MERLYWRLASIFGKERDDHSGRLAGEDTCLLIANLAKEFNRMKLSFPWHG